MVTVMALMKGFGLGGGVVVVFMALMLLTLLGIDGVFVWQLLRLNSRARGAGGAAQSGRYATKELGAHRERALPEPRAGVTESTTHMFEPGCRERRTK